jgi:hypothetical protein
VVVVLVCHCEAADERVDNFIRSGANAFDQVEMMALSDGVGHGEDKVEDIGLL